MRIKVSYPGYFTWHMEASMVCALAVQEGAMISLSFCRSIKYDRNHSFSLGQAILQKYDYHA